MSFDPEEVALRYVEGVNGEESGAYVRVSDYEQLLALYREATKEKFVSTTGFDGLLHRLNP